MEVQRNPYGLPNVIFTMSKSLPFLKDTEQVRELLYESDQRISGHQEEAPSSQHTPLTDGNSVKKWSGNTWKNVKGGSKVSSDIGKLMADSVGRKKEWLGLVVGQTEWPGLGLTDFEISMGTHWKCAEPCWGSQVCVGVLLLHQSLRVLACDALLFISWSFRKTRIMTTQNLNSSKLTRKTNDRWCFCFDKNLA